MTSSRVRVGFWLSVALVLGGHASTITTGAESGAASPSVRPTSNAADGSAAAPSKQRWREGKQVQDLVGTIQLSGQRFVFRDRADGQTLRILENLTLERAARVLDDARPGGLWLVSGIVTEYQAENFLLLTRIVAKPSPTMTSPRTTRPQP